MSLAPFPPVKTSADMKVVESLAYPIWREHYLPIIGAAQVEYMLKKFQTTQAIESQIQQGALYFMIRSHEGEIVGFFAVIKKPGEFFLSKLYLLKTHRGLGYARQALDFIRGLAQERGLTRITLTVHKQNPSVRIYQALGFRILGPVITEIGDGYVMDDYRMSLDFS